MQRPTLKVLRTTRSIAAHPGLGNCRTEFSADLAIPHGHKQECGEVWGCGGVSVRVWIPCRPPGASGSRFHLPILLEEGNRQAQHHLNFTTSPDQKK